jgi:hypothetical protein
MRIVNLGAAGSKVALVSDGSYAKVVRNLIAASRHVCFCNLFIVDIRPHSKDDLSVYSLLLDLACAKWRGIDVRLLIGGSRSNLDMALAAELARMAAGATKVPCRWLTSHRTRGSHSKWVVADDWVLIGSHNWSSGAFAGQTQDSVLVRSDAIAAYLCSKFETVWQRAKGDFNDVSH